MYNMYIWVYHPVRRVLQLSLKTKLFTTQTGPLLRQSIQLKWGI